MNTPVKFEIAKLLEEQGYPFEFITVGELKEVPLNIPTIAEVVMWLYEKHDVWISLIPDISSGHQLLMRKMSVHLFRYRNGLNVQTETLRNIDRDIIYFLSPTEAYEAVIEYTLNNLL